MKTILAVAAIGLTFSTAASADPATTGPGLLDPTREVQLEHWLGAGDMQFTALFTGVPGSTALDFHNALDGKGPSFTLLQVSNAAGASFLVGGYNPQSWSSTDGWHVTLPDSERTAFLFNMTVPAVYRQVPATYILPSQGSRQTFNGAGHGPEFGAGPDLLINGDLDMAISWQVSYGDPADEGKSIFDRSVGAQVFHIDALQMFSVSPIPEPPAVAMFAAGASLLAMLARRRKRAVVS
jgi:hypothetical protein